MSDGPSKNVPAAELDVLAVLRNNGALTAREAREKLQEYRPMTHGAVATLLKRLEQKGLVASRKGGGGKSFLYEAVRQAEEPIRNWLGSTLKRVFQGDQVAFVASLFETRPPTSLEVEQLQAMLDELRRKQKKEK